MANSKYFSSITQEIFISDVLIIMILTPSRDSTSNIFAATPECDRMPTPTRRHFGDGFRHRHRPGANLLGQALNKIDSAAQIRLRNREGNVGHGGLADVLNDHIDHDIGVRHRPEHARGNAGAIRHPDNVILA